MITCSRCKGREPIATYFILDAEKLCLLHFREVKTWTPFAEPVSVPINRNPPSRILRYDENGCLYDVIIP